MTKPLLLDTHVWIWLLAGDQCLSPKATAHIEEAQKNNGLYLSDITLWEVSMLVSKGRITFDQPTLQWLKQALKISNIQLIRLLPEIVVESTELPGIFHDDPADRILVATARILELTLATHDEKILAYGKTHRVHTLKI